MAAAAFYKGGKKMMKMRKIMGFAAYQDLPLCRGPLKHVAHQGNSSPYNRADITTLYKRV